jgi:hypothetical protein
MWQPVQYVGLLNPWPVYIIHSSSTEYSESYSERVPIFSNKSILMRVKVPFIFSNTGQGQPKITFTQIVSMYYRIQGILAIVCYGSSITPSPLSSQKVVSLSQSSCVSPV